MRWILPALGVTAVGGLVAAAWLLSDGSDTIERHGLRIFRERGVCQRSEVTDYAALRAFVLATGLPLVAQGMTEPRELLLVLFREGWPECTWPPIKGTRLADNWQNLAQTGVLDEFGEMLRGEGTIAGVGGPSEPSRMDLRGETDFAQIVMEFLR